MVFSMIVSQVFNLIKQYIIKGMIDLPSNPNFEVNNLYQVTIILLIIIVLELLFYYISNIVRTIHIVKKQTPYISEKLFNHLNKKGYPFFIENFSGKITSSINEVNNKVGELNTKMTTGEFRKSCVNSKFYLPLEPSK